MNTANPTSMQPTPRRVLIVGAGAVGQIYGHYLVQGGADLTFFVKPKYEAHARAGFTLYHLNKRKQRQTPISFTDYDVCTEPAQVAAKTYDMVWLCISATALRGDWLDPFLEATGDATIVLMTPGLEDREHVAAKVPSGRIVSGMIHFISYQTPLPIPLEWPLSKLGREESKREKGIAYYLPPGGKSPFFGAEDRVFSVVNALKRGQFPAARDPKTEENAQLGSSLLIPLIAGLERAGWRWKNFYCGQRRHQALRAARQAMRVARRRYDKLLPFWHHLLRPWTLRVVLRIAAWVMPFDLEVYLAYHFNKVSDQTQSVLEMFSKEARRLKVPHDAIDALRTTRPSD